VWGRLAVRGLSAALRATAESVGVREGDPPQQPDVANLALKRRLTVDEFHRTGETGVLGDAD
jgi:hypothetical protein